MFVGVRQGNSTSLRERRKVFPGRRGKREMGKNGMEPPRPGNQQQELQPDGGARGWPRPWPPADERVWLPAPGGLKTPTCSEEQGLSCSLTAPRMRIILMSSEASARPRGIFRGYILK